jgi:teichuronic acid biosynthesis glycosyltransferase TuaC
VKVLVATAMYPTPGRPAFGSFVRTQVESLQGIGVDADPFVLEGRNRKIMYLHGIPRLRRRLRRGDVDVVHAHYSYVGAVARTQWTAPVVLTFHGDDLLGTIGPNGRQTLLSRGVVAAGKVLARSIDAIVVQNQAMAAALHSHPHVHVLPHEVDLELFRPTERQEARRLLGLDPDRPYVLFASPPDIAVKRFPLAEAAMAVLRDRLPSAELLVVFTETQDRLALNMSACDALVFPSYQEGSPNIVKQAMACNLPIVSTDVGDVAEVIGDTEGCYVVEPKADVFADRLGPLLRRPMRTKGRDRVRHLDGPLVAARLRDLYDEVLERCRRHPREAAGGLVTDVVDSPPDTSLLGGGRGGEAPREGQAAQTEAGAFLGRRR